jgi:hypothetical protein
MLKTPDMEVRAVSTDIERRSVFVDFPVLMRNRAVFMFLVSADRFSTGNEQIDDTVNREALIPLIYNNHRALQ